MRICSARKTLLPNFFPCILEAPIPGVCCFPWALAKGNRVWSNDFLAQVREVPDLDGEVDGHEMGLKGDIKVSGAGGKGGEHPRGQGKVEHPSSCISGGAAGHRHIWRNDDSMQIFSEHGVGNLNRLTIPICNDNPLQVHFFDQGSNGGASPLVRALVQAKAREKVSTNDQNTEALGSVDNATITMRIQRLVVAPCSKARLAQN